MSPDPYHTCYVLNGAAVIAPERFGLQRVCALHGVVEAKRDALLTALTQAPRARQTAA